MIAFINVTKSYPTGQVALSEVNFGVDRGEFVFLIGESGAGKTTIMRLLTKDAEPTKGEIQLEGRSLAKMKKSYTPHLRREVAVVFQDYKLLPDRNVAENIALALEIIGKSKEEIQKRVIDLVRLVGLEEKVGYFPRQLSGGEAQRVSIARALAIGPKVLFADEPTGNLDHESSMLIAHLFDKIHSLGTTIIMATHNLDIVKALKKREIHLHKGKVVKDTTTKHIAKKPESKIEKEEKSLEHNEQKTEVNEKSTKEKLDHKPEKKEEKKNEVLTKKSEKSEKERA